MFLLLFTNLHFTTHLEDNQKRDKDEKKMEMMIDKQVGELTYLRSYGLKNKKMKKKRD